MQSLNVPEHSVVSHLFYVEQLTDVSFEAGYHLLINRALTFFGFFRIPF